MLRTKLYSGLDISKIASKVLVVHTTGLIRTVIYLPARDWPVLIVHARHKGRPHNFLGVPARGTCRPCLGCYASWIGGLVKTPTSLRAKRVLDLIT